MTATLILETLAKELSVEVEHIRAVFEMVDAGLSAPFIGRFRRNLTGGLPESQVRRLHNRRHELEELDRRRGTILRSLESEEDAGSEVAQVVQRCMDRFELEDLFVPHRRPEPEVQLALDRGLGGLAEKLVEPLPRSERPSEPEPEPGPASEEPAAAPPAPEVPRDAGVESGTGAPAQERPAQEAPTEEPGVEPAAPAAGAPSQPPAPIVEAPLIGGLHVSITPDLARLCASFVDPDRGVHTEAEALSGAVRVLSDRLGRNAALRTMVRRILRKRGMLTVRPLVPESKAGRHRPLLKLRKPLRQVQGHRLLAIRQAQKERVLNTSIAIEPELAHGKVRAVFGRHTRPEFDQLLDDIARQALEVRLLPVVEADVRLELKERGDQEALRFLSQHLRQVLLTPPYGRNPVAGVDVSAKGDWTVAVLDPMGEPLARARIEVGDKQPASLAEELRPLLDEHRVMLLCVGHGKGPRAGALKLRAAVGATGIPAAVTIVNESGVSSYANSELARSELPETSVPERMAISLGRRLQDPLAEILKVDPRHLGLGPEQGLVSKANARRIFDETIESSVAHTGCDLNQAPLSVLQNVPGLDLATAKRLIAARQERPFETREQLRADGLLTEAQWTSAIAFLRIPESPELLDRTSLHPELYPLAVQLLESTGGSLEESLGRPGVTKGLRRAAFGVDEPTWRDLMRELAQPGRDPRPRLRRPELLSPDTDPARLSPGRAVEGIVTNVASFGAFVDIGLPADAMVHISEISSRYVRDARELLSIGQGLRARILPGGGARLGLSLKDVPRPERRPRPGAGGRARGEGEERDRRRGGSRREERPKNLGRGQLIGGGSRRRSGPGRGAPRLEHMSRDERADLDRINRASKAAAYNPFADFFKKGEAQQAGSGGSEPECEESQDT